ncbi:hypothetical protein EJ074_01855 [Mesorhizobium sp. M3A.F.Ca.ET.080.04.2.1]|uniref:hypothetical protein n=1 Tax=Mesorhizobium sp. M3A.F.Ca.ET.080.04.2.1 TaxID=2493676 RepID=UPI000F756ECB|nr:hypothetical protein [Mesorhizobium sp. M3A.F.Ca.ET.080.04.2.1]AZO08001.1 hypothetical protein EJ074_01855 [Mesorhizobium sp. M3A.F.Ca.ET.080.04.2.1]
MALQFQKKLLDILPSMSLDDSREMEIMTAYLLASTHDPREAMTAFRAGRAPIMLSHGPTMAQARADQTLFLPGALRQRAARLPVPDWPLQRAGDLRRVLAAAGTAATAMLAQGVKAGERVVTICENSIELFVVIVAAGGSAQHWFP